MSRPKPVGIDLGTTFSAVAWIGPSGKTEMLPNDEGEILTPSVVQFEDEHVAVGREARRAALLEPDRVAQWVKRDMGQKVFSHPIRGNWLPPEVIQACILQRLKIHLVKVLGPNIKVVITVPAYFDEPRRKATADAGEMAGLDVLDIVNEPTAAALAFGESIGYLSRSGDVSRPLTVLVYDLGGGTFDVTLMRLAPGNVECLAIDGDVRLGGYDWDMRLVDHLAGAFERRYGVDPRKDAVGQGRLIEGAIAAKHALSDHRRARVRVKHGGKSLDVTVTRPEFAGMTADLLERTLHTCRQLMAQAGKQWQDVDRLLLVGGATRMPMVVDAMQKLTGLTPEQSVHPDEAVARGAALYARYLLAKEAPPDEAADAGFDVRDVSSHSLGVEGIDPATLRKTNVKLIPRNAPLPASHTERFTTKAAGQRSITIRVLQGESSDPDECTLIGRTVLADLPEGLPQGWPVEVSFDYQPNGRLAVHTVVPGTARELTLELERSVGLNDRQLAHWKPLVTSRAGFEALEAMVEDVLDENLPAVESPASTAAPRTASHQATAATSPAGRSPSETGPKPKVPGPELRHGRAIPKMGSGPVSASPRTPSSLAVPTKPVTMSVKERRRAGPADPLPRWAVLLIVWLTSAVTGLAAGYWVLSIWYPDRFPLPW